MNGLYDFKPKKRGFLEIPGPKIFPDTPGPNQPLSHYSSQNTGLGTEPDIPPITPGINQPLSNISPETNKTPGLIDYWKQPVFGKMPLDKFVQLAGMLGHAIAPETPMGRVGGALAQMGGQAYAERMRREDPESILKNRLLEARIKEAERVEEPKITSNKVADPNSETGYSYVDEFGRIIATGAPGPKELEKDNIKSVSTQQSGGLLYSIITYKDGRVEAKPIIPEEQKGTPVTTEGITETPLGPPQDPLKAPGKEYAPQAQSLVHPKTGKREWFDMNKQEDIERARKGGFIPYEKPSTEKEKLTMTDIKSAYSMDIGNIKNQMMVDMTPDEQMNLAGQPDVNILALLLSGRVGKSLSPEKKKYYIERLRGLEEYYGDLTNQVFEKKGAKAPPKSPAVVEPEKTPPNIQKLHDQATEAIKMQPKRTEEIKKQYKEMTGREYK